MLILEADEAVATTAPLHMNTDMLQELDLMNRLSYKHEPEYGHLPLSYAVAKNLKQMVYDLINLSAEVIKAMLQQIDSDGEEYSEISSSHQEELPVMALVIVAMNPK